MQLKIESIELADPAFQPIVQKLSNAIQESKKLIVEREELPRYMTKKQASSYMNVSYNTMMQKYVPQGLKIIVIDGVTRIDQKDCDDFMKEFKK